MKNFTKKIFMLSAAMLLSVVTFAQSGEIKHRFPQFDFTYGSDKTEAYVPAWDGQTFTDAAPGCVRYQITEVVHQDETQANCEYNAQLVSRLGVKKDLSAFVYLTSTTNVTFKDKNGNTTTKQAGQVKYSDFIDVSAYSAGTWFAGTTYDHADYNVFNLHDESYLNARMFVIGGDYTVPSVYSNKYGKYNITAIDYYAFYNYTVSRTNASEYWFRPQTITIPASITTIRKGAFFNNIGVEKITFASNSQLKDIPAQAFMNYFNMTEITFPASIETIGGAALGGCEKLEKIVFEGATPPTLGKYRHTDGVDYNFMTATSTTFSSFDPAKCIMEVPLHSAKAYTEKADVFNTYKYKEFPMSSKFPITTSSGMMSYCSDLPFTFKQYDTDNQAWNKGDVEVYYVTKSNVDLNNNNIELTEITSTDNNTKKIPLDNPKSNYGFGVILKGEANKTYDIFYPNDLPTEEFAVTENLLQGVTESTTMVLNANYLYYALSGGKFHPIQLSSDDPDKNKIGAHKAFLMFVTDENWNLGGAREFTISFPETTGIVSHEIKSGQNNVFYNLQGVQVKNPGKGVFIKNGKKYIIK